MPRPYSFEPYGVGRKRYNGGFESSPHYGEALDPLGYRERDLKTRQNRNAMLRRMKATQSKKYMSPDYLRGPYA